MAGNNIHSRLIVSPRLVRKRTVVPSPIILVPAALRPQPISKTIDLAKGLKNRVVIRPQSQTPAIEKPRELVRHIKPSKKIRYLTADNTSLDIAMLNNLANAGKGRICVIIGNGPSVLEVDLQHLKNQPLLDIMSVNHPDSRVWPSRYWCFFDNSQLLRHQDKWNNYTGILFNSTAIRQRRPTTIQLKNIGGSGFSKDIRAGFYVGQSSVYVSMQIALWLGYEHIYIIGVDMCEVNGRLHYYGVNPDVTPAIRKSRFNGEAAFYDQAAKILTTEERAKFTFCSTYNKYPFVDQFNRMDHTICVIEITHHAIELAIQQKETQNVK